MLFNTVVNEKPAHVITGFLHGVTEVVDLPGCYVTLMDSYDGLSPNIDN
jgi:hypothetical protein